MFTLLALSPSLFIITLLHSISLADQLLSNVRATALALKLSDTNGRGHLG